MEINWKSPGKSGKAVIITVEELERRKERFRRATKEYYEQAERGYRSLHGFCSKRDGIRFANEESTFSRSGTGKRKRVEDPTNTFFPLKRCRRRRNQMQVPELEADLARSLLESHFAIVELATKEYLFSIKNLVRYSPSFLRSSQQLSRVTYREGETILLRVPTISPISVALPLPIAFDTNQQGECLQTRLQRHLLEASEEQDMAMASAMQAVRESKITEGLARKIYNGIDPICSVLRKVSSLIETNRNNTFYCCHYDSFQSDTEPTIDTTLCGKRETSAVWDRKVVEAQKLDGYYSWFRANNGVLLVQNKNEHDNSKANGTISPDVQSKTFHFEKLGIDNCCKNRRASAARKR
eukprot:CAMPEP_0116090152 /NCGR_PEP_ID=MMETSP0327-20121206/6802_1 /TAXON_ID=44447 /ORGANISM="Pseudo-nitzschia delicatissima, Strain B596" /LENGTH=353 /DNA_ID=CAMNT_0003581383 /DNA_START=116 /DNA_END=1174 /DNA_ORIENTATION=+